MTLIPQIITRAPRIISKVNRFHTVTLDPPWNEAGAGKIQRGANRHYPLMKLPDIYRTVALSECWHPADDAHMYLWVTNNFLPSGLELMRQLDFRYVTNLAWLKVSNAEEVDADEDLGLEDYDFQTGLGQYFRGAHELCLFGVRGQGQAECVMTDAKNLKTVFAEKREAHSAKPLSFHDRVEARSKGPYVEYFAREPRDGWTSFGNQLAA